MNQQNQDDPTIPNRTFMERGYIVARYNHESPPAEVWCLRTSDGRILHRRIEFAAPPQMPKPSSSVFAKPSSVFGGFGSHNIPFGSNPSPPHSSGGFGSHNIPFGS